MTDSRTENAAVLFTDVEGSSAYFKVHGDGAGRELLLEHHKMVGDAVEKHGGTSVKTIGDSVLAYFNDPAAAVLAAVCVQESIEEHFNVRPPEEQIRIRIAIHYGPVIIEKGDIFGDVVNWASKLTHLTPGGDIYVSRLMFDQLKGTGNWFFEPRAVKDPDIAAETGAFRILRHSRFASSRSWPDTDDETIPGAFRYRKQLVEGEHRPCFYCGSSRHKAGECPSKDLPEVTDALEKLGYMSVEDINLLFSEYLRQKDTEYDNPILIAHHAFYDLKRIFQLRFFRCVWDAGNKTWDEVSKNMPSGSRWGTAWAAQDCIRVSNYDKAEAILADSDRLDNPDYKVHCASGFMNLEKGFLYKARAAFSTALRFTRSAVERTYILFLLDRMTAFMQADDLEAKDWLNEILMANRWCHEALYREIIRAFRKGQTASALKRLEKLIREERSYYMVALIDPDLKASEAEVAVMLQGLLDEARNLAAALLPRARKALAWLEKAFEEHNEGVKAAKASWTRMQELMKKNGYFNFLDVAQCGEDICSAYDRELRSQKRIVRVGVDSIARRLGACSGYVRKFKSIMSDTPFPADMEALEGRMKHLHSRSASSDPVTIRENLALIATLKGLIEDMEYRLNAFDKKRRLKNFTLKFLENAALVTIVAILAAFVLIPVLWNVFRDLEVMIQIDMRSIQKGLLIMSIIGGWGRCFLVALRTLYDE